MLTFACLGSAAWAADFKDGLAAYNAGDFARAYEIFLPLAQAGDAKSQHLLGHMYILGDGVEQDDKEAVKWFRESAKQGVVIQESYSRPATTAAAE